MINRSLNFQTGFKVFKKIWKYPVNLSLVYFLEYVIFSGFADRANPIERQAVGNNFFERNAFVVLQICYEIGVLISRSSLPYIKISKTEILTFLQFINFCVFFIEAKLLFLSIYIQCAIMIFVGLLGGSSYVNTFFLLLESNTIKKSQKEMAVNITSIFDDTGVILASIFTMIAANTFLKSNL